MRRLLIVLCIVVSGVSIPISTSAASIPKGAVVLKKSSLVKVGTTQCGKVKGSWISGKVTKARSKNYFVSHQKRSNLYLSDARRARGTQKKKLLGLANVYKKKASVGNKRCARLNVKTPVATTVPATITVPVVTTTPMTAQALRFDIGDAVALALTNPTVSSANVRKNAVGSNLRALDREGKMTDAVVGGKANIKRFLIAPNDKLYVEFSTRAQVGQSANCLLAEVNPVNGEAICVEDDLQVQILEGSRDEGLYGQLLNDIQFDAGGSIYYQVRVPPTPNHGYQLGTAQFVRRLKNGVKTDFGYGIWEERCFVGFCPGNSGKFLLNPVLNFLVLPDGTLYIEQKKMT